MSGAMLDAGWILGGLFVLSLVVGGLWLWYRRRSTAERSIIDQLDQFSSSGWSSSTSTQEPAQATPPDPATMPEVLVAVQEGRKLEAVQLYRNQTGVRLNEAKEVVDTLSRDMTFEALDAAAQKPATDTDDSWQGEVRALLAHGRKTAAIKLYWERTGVGLKEAKEAVEAMQQGRG